MININYVETPTLNSDGTKPAHTRWVDGKCKLINEFGKITVFIGHKTEKRIDENGNEQEIMVAFPIITDFPITRAKLINAAEMEAYSLKNAMEVASLNAALGRKFRDNPLDSEVKEHDEFIHWVKQELTAIKIK